MPDTAPASTPSVPNILHTTGSLDPDVPITELRMPDGRVLRVATSFLHGADLSNANASTLDLRPSDRHDARSTDAPSATADTERIPIIEERLRITRETVPTANVRLHKTVESYTTALDEPLAVRTYDVERTVLNQVVETAPGIRTEGDTTIYPIVEEQAVVTKQLVLKEEIRVTRRDTERRDQQTVTLQREHVEIEREPLIPPAPQS